MEREKDCNNFEENMNYEYNNDICPLLNKVDDVAIGAIEAVAKIYGYTLYDDDCDDYNYDDDDYCNGDCDNDSGICPLEMFYNRVHDAAYNTIKALGDDYSYDEIHNFLYEMSAFTSCAVIDADSYHYDKCEHIGQLLQNLYDCVFEAACDALKALGLRDDDDTEDDYDAYDYTFFCF